VAKRLQLTRLHSALGDITQSPEFAARNQFSNQNAIASLPHYVGQIIANKKPAA
jgi:hypothetical protein